MQALLVALSLAAGQSPNRPPVTDAYFDSDGVKIHYVTAGEGEPVLLVHGWISDATMWGSDASGNAKPRPPEGFQLIALDCRGHGKSDKPHDAAKYGVELANDVVRLLDHLKIRKAHLVGYSMGTFIVAKVAAMHPERVRSLVFAGQSPLIVGEPSAGPNEIDVLAKAVEEGKGLGAYIMHIWPPERGKLTTEQAEAYAKLMFNGKDPTALALAGQSFPKLGVTADQLKNVKVPMLFVYGSKEGDRLKQRVSDLRKLLGETELKVVEGADHTTTLTKPEFSTTLVAFLRSQKAK